MTALNLGEGRSAEVKRLVKVLVFRVQTILPGHPGSPWTPS